MRVDFVGRPCRPCPEGHRCCEVQPGAPEVHYNVVHGASGDYLEVIVEGTVEVSTVPWQLQRT